MKNDNSTVLPTGDSSVSEESDPVQFLKWSENQIEFHNVFFFLNETNFSVLKFSETSGWTTLYLRINVYQVHNIIRYLILSFKN